MREFTLIADSSKYLIILENNAGVLLWHLVSLRFRNDRIWTDVTTHSSLRALCDFWCITPLILLGANYSQDDLKRLCTSGDATDLLIFG